MRKLLIYLLLGMVSIVWFSGCERYEIIQYGEEGQINFMGKDKYGWTDDTAYLHYDRNFAINSQGDSLLVDTVSIGVKISGTMKDYVRKVMFNVEHPGEYALEVMFPEEYYVDADTGTAVFTIFLKRPVKQGKVYTAELIFDYDGSDFEAGTWERQVFRLSAQDSVSLELWGTTEEEWADYYKDHLGDYSATKVRYLITKYHKTSIEEWSGSTQYAELRKQNAFYLDYEAYRATPGYVPLLDEKTGREIEFPNLN